MRCSPRLRRLAGRPAERCPRTAGRLRADLPPRPAARATYTFKHALVQDAAYQSLLKSKRQQLHARIAQVLEEQFPETARPAGSPGPHLTEAGLADEAIPYWRRAGELAAGRSANVEAIAHLSKALELIGTLPDARSTSEEELALRLAIGGPLMATKGYAAPEVERTYSRASALCDQLGRSAELFPVLRGLWNYYNVRGELQRAHDLAERLVVLADAQEGAAPPCPGPARAGNAVLPWPVCRCGGSPGRGHRDRRRGRGLGGSSCRPPALHGARQRGGAGSIQHGPFGSSAFPTVLWPRWKLASPWASASRTPTASPSP